MAKRPTKAIGVDIGSSSIKLAEVSLTGGQYVLDRMTVYELEENVWKDGLPQDLEVARINLERALKLFNGSTKNIVMSVPTSALMVRNVALSANLKDDDLWDTIEANLTQYIPFSADEVMLDFQVMGPSKGIAGHNDVLITAVQRDFVNLRDLIAEMSDAKLTIVDGDAYALLNLINMVEPTNTYTAFDGAAIIEIGLYRTGFHVILGDGSLYVREFPIGGERFTEIISDLGNIPLDQAEERKRVGNWDEDTLLQEAFTAFVDELGEQVLSAIEVYLPNNPQVNLRRYFVAGATAAVPGLVTALGEKIDREATALNINELFTLSQNMRGQSTAGLEIACGLAVRSLL